MQLANKCILVTGASGGIGSALCRQLEQQNVSLIMSCFRVNQLKSTQLSLEKPHTTVIADVSTVEGRQQIVTACAQKGGIDGLINLAGIMDFSLFEKQDVSIIEKNLAVNTIAPILLCHELLPQLLLKPEAFILNVGSIFGSIGHPGFSVYCASKAALKTFSEALSRELADTAVSVSYIAPRATSTALNTDRVNALNAALGNKSDSPDYVARQIIRSLRKDERQRFLGWPEKLFVKINALCPSIVHGALVKKLQTIKQFTNP
ncbi:MAG: short chain dehydrogenase [Gammaproteobacteria bacterium]|nr:short chain dehydrogenase [Gammaproteobacteria bacterium]|tara:strand:+ start:27666 stop:28451 length:786 start_codon:yes stop_codon:yes gene_type:complete